MNLDVMLPITAADGTLCETTVQCIYIYIIIDFHCLFYKIRHNFFLLLYMKLRIFIVHLFFIEPFPEQILLEQGFRNMQ